MRIRTELDGERYKQLCEYAISVGNIINARGYGNTKIIDIGETHTCRKSPNIFG